MDKIKQGCHRFSRWFDRLRPLRKFATTNHRHKSVVCFLPNIVVGVRSINILAVASSIWHITGATAAIEEHRRLDIKLALSLQ